MSNADFAYLRLLEEALEKGTAKNDRTGTGTRSVFGRQLRFDLFPRFPLLTTKKVYWRGVVEELLWFLRGETNARVLEARGVNIWSPWVRETHLGRDSFNAVDHLQAGELGPIYGKQWRSWGTAEGWEIDQLAGVLDQLQEDPDSRRHIVSAWNVGELEDMALAPCHLLFQFYVRPLSKGEREVLYDQGQLSTHGRVWVNKHTPRELDDLGVPRSALDCQVYQRSADIFIGLPFNIASYGLLTHLVARHVGMAPGELVWTGGDCHLYSNHFEQAGEQLSREPLPAPRLRWNTEETDIFRAAVLTQPELVELEGYNPHPAIRAEVAV